MRLGLNENDRLRKYTLLELIQGERKNNEKKNTGSMHCVEYSGISGMWKEQ